MKNNDKPDEKLRAVTANIANPGGKGDLQYEDVRAKAELDPFSPSPTLTPSQALKLAALEQAENAPMTRRVSAGNDPRQEEARRKRAQARDAFVDAAMQWRTPEQWDSEMTIVAGVRMTNAEAQAARQRILDKPDQHVAWAKEQGLIAAGDEAAFVATVREMHQIKARQRASGGRMTPEDQRRFEQLQNSVIGRAADQTTAQVVKGMRLSADASFDQVATTSTTAIDGAQAHRTRTALVAASEIDAPTFPDMKPLAPTFASAVTAPAQDDLPVDPAPGPAAPIDRSIKATGLDI